MGATAEHEDFNPPMSNSEYAEFSLKDDCDLVHCSICGDLYIQDDSDLCRHLALPLFEVAQKGRR